MHKNAWVVVAALGVVMVPAASEACGNSYYHRLDPRVKAMQDAEALMNTGQVGLAAQRVVQLYPQIATQTGTGALAIRARTVMALAVVRNGGQWPVKADAKARPDEPALWAVRHLRAADAAAHGIPRTESDLAEALGALPEGADEASKILERLAAKKVIPSAHAWATLARLRKAQGNENAGWAALAECRKRASYNGICRMQAPAPGAAVKQGRGTAPAKKPSAKNGA